MNGEALLQESPSLTRRIRPQRNKVSLKDERWNNVAVLVMVGEKKVIRLGCANDGVNGWCALPEMRTERRMAQVRSPTTANKGWAEGGEVLVLGSWKP